MKFINGLIVVALIALVGCTPPPTPAPESIAPEVVPTETRKTQADTISSWEITGVMAARNSKKAWTASVNWEQKGINQYQIRLFGPLGNGTVMISKNGGAITFQDGPKKVSSNNADALLLKQTGISLPVTHLYYWVRGIPAPGKVTNSTHDKYNRLTSLSQNGYHIEYGRYTNAKNVELPSLIKLQGHGVVIKLVIKRWAV